MFGRWKAAAAVSGLLLASVMTGAAMAAPKHTGPLSSSTPAPGPSSSTPTPATPPSPPTPPAEAHSCAKPAPGQASCHAVQLLYPSSDWHPGPAGHGPGGGPGGGGGGAGPATVAPPSQGYYPADLQSAYNTAAAAAAITAGSTAAPTIAIVDAYDDPNAQSDLSAYRASLSGATDPNTGLPDQTIPPLCSNTVTTGCVTFQKLTPQGLPQGNTGWATEITLDLDMASAICPNCNIDLVEAASASFSNLASAVNYAKGLSPTPAVVTNSYGGSEFSGESTYNGYYSSATKTAVTVSSGDSGYTVEFPSADPSTTAVGGTSLSYSGFGASLSWNPQTVWSTSANEGAGSGCSTQESLPSWQSLSGVYNLSADCAGRQVADISAVADPATGVAVYGTYGMSGWAVYGGTSASAQIVGAMYALAAGAGSLNPASSALYPDTSANGNKGSTPGLVPVLSGSTANCGNYLCNAGDHLSSGYNGPAGLGTPFGISALSSASSTSGNLTFSPTSESLAAGNWAGPIQVVESKSPGSSLTVNLSTSSPTGRFASSPGGTSVTSVIIPAGSTSTAFYYYDQTAGTSTVTASATTWGSGSLPVSVTPGPVASVSVSPGSASVPTGGTQVFTGTAYDTYNNPVPGTVFNWSTSAPGQVSPSSGSSTTTFTAALTTGSGPVTASYGTASNSATVTVTSQPSLSVKVTAGSASRTRRGYKVPLTVTVTDSSSNLVGGASVSLNVYNGACPGTTVTASGSGTTSTSGTVGFNFTTGSQTTYCAVASASKSGYLSGTSPGTTFNS